MIEGEVAEENSLFGPLTANEKPRIEIELPPLPETVQATEVTKLNNISICMDIHQLFICLRRKRKLNWLEK